MNKIVRFSVLMPAVFSLAACATVVRGTTEDVVINYSPNDATVTTSIGHTCQTNPCTINVERKKEFTVTARKSGYTSQTVAVGTKISGKGAAGMAGNIVAGGIIGVGVDAATGAGKDHFPNPVNIQLQRIGSKSPPPAKPAKPSAPGKRRIPTS